MTKIEEHVGYREMDCDRKKECKRTKETEREKDQN